MTRKKWKTLEKAEFLERTGHLIKRGYTLANSVEVYGLNARPQIQQMTAEIIKQLKDGDPLHDVLGRYEFPNDALAHLYFFEYHDLSAGLIQSGKILRKREEFKRRLEKTLQYPIFLLWLAMILLFVIIHYVFPQFTRLFTSVDTELPLITNLMIRIVDFFPLFLLFIIAMLILLFGTYIVKFRKQSPQKQIDRLLKIPFINTITRLMLTQRLSANLSSLLKAGISINEAMHIFEQQTHSLFFQQEATDIKFRLKSGESLEAIIVKRRAYRPEFAAIIRHGHLNGQLADELSVYADILLQKLEEFLQKSLHVLQPVIFSLLGILILILFLAIMLPMLQFIQTL